MSSTLITGCATGFGRLVAQKLLQQGEYVVATDPNQEAVQQALDPDGAYQQQLRVLHLDLSDPTSIHEAANAALTWQPIKNLVHNGGYAVFGTQADTDLKAVRAMFEVNLFGAMELSQALLPSIRQQQGTLCLVSSVAGRMVFPESGFYAASKYGIEALGEALFVENCTFGVKVRLIEPGAFATQFLTRAQSASGPRNPDSAYTHLFPIWDAHKTSVLEAPQKPTLVADAIIGALSAGQPFERLVVGRDAVRILRARDASSPDAWVLDLAAKSGFTAT